MFADMTGLSLKVISAMGDAEMMTYQKDAKVKDYFFKYSKLYIRR